MRPLWVLAVLGAACAALYSAEFRFTEAQKAFSVKRAAVPQVKHKAWVKTPIEAFILAQLEGEKIQPSAPADRLTLLRRVSK